VRLTLMHYYCLASPSTSRTARWVASLGWRL
jgi:hypothetical protein